MGRITEEDIKFMLRSNYYQITEQYASYVTCIRDSLVSIQEKDDGTKDNLCHHLLGLRARDSGSNVAVEGRKLLSELKSELAEANDIDEIIGMIEENCASYLNIWIFQNIVDQFRLDTCQEALKYPVFLQQYIEKHKISEIVEKLTKFENCFGGYTEFTFKLDIDLAKKFTKLISIEKAIAKILGISPAAIILKKFNIEEDGVVVTTCIPTFVAEDIFRHDQAHPKVFTQEEKNQFRSLSVLWLKCGHQTFVFKGMWGTKNIAILTGIQPCDPDNTFLSGIEESALCGSHGFQPHNYLNTA